MNSNSNSNSNQNQIGKGIVDNGAKWGSYVTRNADGSFPYDERMAKERPEDFNNMIIERMAPIYATASNPRYITPKRYAVGRTIPFKK